MQQFIGDGFEQVYFDADMNYDSFIEKVKTLEQYQEYKIINFDSS